VERLLVSATAAVIRRRAVEREDPYPERSFGEAFLPYEARVPRWV
jgi:protein-S-isoprenylcysteine O-methyltransferase Ste14